ncbi:MAG: dihydrodipicolinate synthase family protein [Coprococcus sp.]
MAEFLYTQAWACISTKDTIRMSKMAESLGADVLSIITPSFAAASRERIEPNASKTVAEAVPNMPIRSLQHSCRTGNAIAPDTVGRLAEIDNIVGAKDSSGNFNNILEYIAKTDKNFSVLSGNAH